MSRFRILRVDYYDPQITGKKTRFLHTIYILIPFFIMTAFNLGQLFGMGYLLTIIILIPFLLLIWIFLIRKVRSEIKNLKTIGEIEITKSGIRKRLGDATYDYNYQIIKCLHLSKHIPATRIMESKTRYFSYILKIILWNKQEELLVVSDRSLDHNHKISLAETMRTLKKIVPFEVTIEL